MDASSAIVRLSVMMMSERDGAHAFSIFVTGNGPNEEDELKEHK
jgi:hypothetical protein